MKEVAINYALSVIAILAIFYKLFSCGYLDSYDLYTKTFRHYFFTAFLAIGSFIFTLMTAVLFSMKERVYDNKKYRLDYVEHRESGKNSQPLYEPLVNIGRLFIFTVTVCMITSVEQITIGLVANNFVAALGFSLAVSTILLIVYVLKNVKYTMERWFVILEQWTEADDK